MAIELGCVSMIILLSMVIILLIRAIKCLRKYNSSSDEFDNVQLFLFSCVISVIGYLMSSFFNDGMVMTAPIFWLIAGLLAGVVHKFQTYNNEM